jgi:hypothetical protein
MTHNAHCAVPAEPSRARYEDRSLTHSGLVSRFKSVAWLCRTVDDFIAN